MPVILLGLLGVVVGYSQKITPKSKEKSDLSTENNLDSVGSEGD